MEKGMTFLSGIGRSGTTIFYKVLSHHRDVYWLSPFTDKYINKPNRNDFIVNNIDSWMPPYFRKRIEPVECYNFFNKSFRGFARPFRDLTKEDVSERTRNLLRKSFERFDTSKKAHMTVKVTGWPRLGFLNEVFPEAKFIHIKREGKAVVNSFLNVHFWNGWQGVEKWRWGNLSEEHKKLWEKYDYSFVALAAIQYIMYMEAFKNAKSLIGNDKVLEIKYEDFIVDPIHEMKKSIDFMGLTLDHQFEKKINSFKITDNNVKWKNDLSSIQQQILGEILDPVLSSYDY